MSGRIIILLVSFVLMSACGDQSVTKGVPAPDMEHATDTDTDPPDVNGVDQGPDLTPDMDIPTGPCEELDLQGCYLRSDCGVLDGACLTLLPSPLPFPPGFATLASGVITIGEHDVLAATGEQAIEVMLTGETEVIGSIRMTSPDRDWVFPLRGTMDEGAGRFELVVSVPECLAGGTSCVQVVPALVFSGVHTNGSWLFPSPSLAQGVSAGFDFVQNLRFQPNDGIKPSTVPGVHYSAIFFTSLEDSPLSGKTECLWTLDDLIDATGELVEIDCPTHRFRTTSEPGILPNSLKFERGRVAFVMTAEEGNITFLGLSGQDIGGILVLDDGRYYDPEAGIPDPSTVAPEHVIGSLLLEAL